MKIKIALVIILCFCAFSNSYCQFFHKAGDLGLSAAIGNSTQADIILPIWISQSSIIAPDIAIASAASIGTDIGIGVIYKKYLMMEKLSPFLSAKFGALMYYSVDGPIIPDYVLSGAFGGDYFFSDNFSIGIEGQINAVFSHSSSLRFGNPGNVNINTASMIIATIYF